MEDLGDMTSDQSGWSSAQGVNADGSVIVGVADDDTDNNRAFRWTEETGMQTLGPCAATITGPAMLGACPMMARSSSVGLRMRRM